MNYNKTNPGPNEPRRSYYCVGQLLISVGNTKNKMAAILSITITYRLIKLRFRDYELQKRS